MFNAEKPSLDELPSSAQLLRSTVVAAVAAVAILTTVVLPAEYGIDPTGAGRVLGLTEMGEIKNELAEEAEADHQSSQRPQSETVLLSRVLDFFIASAQAQDTGAARDRVEFTLAPGETHELKLTMNKDDVATFRMLVEGGRVNYDLHAHGDGESITYEKKRGAVEAEGELKAAFDGDHGWFWRNRDKTPLSIVLELDGAYTELKQKP